MYKQRQRKATLKDVAKKANVALSTASEILNNKNKKNYSSQVVRERVMQAAHDLNYERNIGYRIMVGEKVNIVGIIFSQPRVIYDESNENIVLQLSQRLKQRLNCAVFTEVMGNDVGKNLKTISNLINTGCHSFIFCGSPVGGNEICGFLKERDDLDYISLGCKMFDKSIVSDPFYTFSMYCDRLNQDGRKNFKVAMPAYHLNKFRRCWRDIFPGLTEDEIIKNHEFAIPDSEFHNYDCSDEMFEIGYNAAREIIKRDKSTQGIIFIHDIYAMGAGKCLLENDIVVGQEIAIFGTGKTNLTRYSIFPVTSSDVETDKVVNLLIDNLERKEPVSISLKPQIIWRP